jgi:2-iminobutanoate/2-iminopropanoate deaminase
LVVGIWTRASAVVIAALMVVFLAAIGWALAHGYDIRCGCFGTVDARKVGFRVAGDQRVAGVASGRFNGTNNGDKRMKRQIVATDAAPKAVGPYSQAVWAGDYLFCAGQIPLDPGTGNIVAGGITEQATRVLDNIRGLLKSQGLDFANVVKSTVFLSDMNNFAAMNEVYAKYFTQEPPARSTVQVARLPKDALVEIEVIAAR